MTLSSRLLSIALGMSILWSATTVAESQDVLHNADVIKMVSAQLAPETIVLKIETSVGQFDVSTDALTELKAAGVPDVAIAAMIKASAKSPLPPKSPEGVSPASIPSTTINKAIVYIYRPGKFIGKSLEPSVFLDEQKLLDMDNARYLALKLEPGRHILRSNEKNSEIDQVWDAKTYYIKITIAPGMLKGHGQMGMVTEKLALEEIHKLRPLDKDHVEAGYLAIIDLTPIR